MNWDELKGQWKQFKGAAKTKWGKLTDDEITQLEGNKDQIIGKLQERYGYKKTEAEREVNQWAESLNAKIDRPNRSETARR